MFAEEIIRKKRDGKNLTPVEIKFFVENFMQGKIADYQMSAFLMAVFFSGMNSEETLCFTGLLKDSGKTFNLSSVSGPKVDKHSTGGVGDGISLALAPLISVCGIVVPMVAGRALGHTGGTLDKLESIPGFKVNLSREGFLRQLKKIGVAIIGQSKDLVPADKIIYSLRDVTATVDSAPLIVSSIISKKIAEGSTHLVVDVKTGSGAFMRRLVDAWALARSLVNTGKKSGIAVKALITDMSQPLGEAIGNSLEVKQAIEILKGGGPEDFRRLLLELGGWMLVMAKKAKNLEQAKQKLQEVISNGAGLEKFAELVKAQGGDPKIIEHPDKILPKARRVSVVTSPKEGYVYSLDTRLIGEAATVLGAGRAKIDDSIDPAAGIIIKKKLGDKVKKGEPLAFFHWNTDQNLSLARDKFLKAYQILPKKPKIQPLIYDVIG
ncbi:MAG: thymidine phosphorylase [Elusimicrobiota bacterium]